MGLGVEKEEEAAEAAAGLWSLMMLSFLIESMRSVGSMR